jgi:hypothetical protein
MFEGLKLKRAPEKKSLEKLSDTEFVSLAKKGLESELARLHMPGHDNLSRINEQNVSFRDIPPEERAAGFFAHRANWYGPAWKEIVVDRNLAQYSKAKVLVHEGLHMLSADEKGGGGARKYLSTLAKHGFSGLDEGITEHYAQFLTPRVFPQFANPEVDKVSRQDDASNSYAHLVTFVERMLRQAAEKARGPQESEEDAYKRARDFLYEHYLKADHDTVLQFLNLNVSPGIGQLLGAISSPRGKEGAEGHVSHQASKDALDKVQRLSETFSKSRQAYHDRASLTMMVDKWYLDPKNYPGYPDQIKDSFVAEAVYAYHFWSISERLAGPMVLTNPCYVELSTRDASELLLQAQLVEEDLRIMDNRYKGLSDKAFKLRTLGGLLRILGHARDPGARKNWEAIVKGIHADKATPEGQELQKTAQRAFHDLKSDLWVFVPRMGSSVVNSVFDYLEKQLAGDSTAVIAVAKPEV